MSESNMTQVTPMVIRENSHFNTNENCIHTTPEWQDIASPKPRGQSWLKNMAVASALVLCAVTLRTGALPTFSTATDAILTVATDQSLLDDQLGKLSFVSALFPEAVLVFGESTYHELTMPVSGGTVIHTWSEDEPYLSLRTNSSRVLSASSGEVVGIYHGNGEEQLVQVFGEGGLSCIYGNLMNVNVQIGEQIEPGQVVGTILPGKDLIFEVKLDGFHVDPAKYMLQ